MKHLAREAKCPDTALDKARQAIAKNGTSHARAEVCTDALESHIPLDPNALFSSALADPGTTEPRQPTSTIAAGPFVIPSDYVRPRGSFVAREACLRGIGDRHVLALTWQNRLEPTYLLDVAYFGTPAKVAVFNRPASPKSAKAKPKELVVATSEPASLDGGVLIRNFRGRISPNLSNMSPIVLAAGTPSTPSSMSLVRIFFGPSLGHSFRFSSSLDVISSAVRCGHRRATGGRSFRPSGPSAS